MTSLCGYLLSSVYGDYPFASVNLLWLVLPLLGLKAGQANKRLVTTQEVSQHPQMEVTNSNILRKNVKYYVDSTSFLVKYLSIKMI